VCYELILIQLNLKYRCAWEHSRIKSVVGWNTEFHLLTMPFPSGTFLLPLSQKVCHTWLTKLLCVLAWMSLWPCAGSGMHCPEGTGCWKPLWARTLGLSLSLGSCPALPGFWLLHCSQRQRILEFLGSSSFYFLIMLWEELRGQVVIVRSLFLHKIKNVLETVSG
jgi:hypothetical protein